MKASTSGSFNTLTITLIDSGCSPDDLQVPAGPRNFVVANGGTGIVSQMELKNSGGIILGESENVVPGVPGHFSLDLFPGRYIINCPTGNSQDQGQLVVTGTPGARRSGPSAALLTRATAGYKSYVETQSGELTSDTKRFVAALRSGQLSTAERLFGPARLHYESIEPVAESFGQLDPDIDARINDVVNVKSWTGFHRIERTLWEQHTTRGTGPYATKLMHDVETLQRKVQAIQLQPAQLANGAVELMNEVANSKITGEEDRYSHTDLSDFQGNLSGSRKAFDLLIPSLQETGTLNWRAPSTAASLPCSRASIATDATPLGYALYSALTPADRKTLAAEVDALAEPLSQVAARVSGA